MDARAERTPRRMTHMLGRLRAIPCSCCTCSISCCSVGSGLQVKEERRFDALAEGTRGVQIKRANLLKPQAAFRRDSLGFQHDLKAVDPGRANGLPRSSVPVSQ